MNETCPTCLHYGDHACSWARDLDVILPKWLDEVNDLDDIEKDPCDAWEGLDQ